MANKTVTIDQFLTDAEIQRAARLYTDLGGTVKFASTVAEEIIKPNMGRINASLGQENDPRYLAYMVEYILSRATHRQ